MSADWCGTGGELRWSIRRSFSAYVAALPDGAISAEDGAGSLPGGGFVWPARGATEHTFEFRGLIAFRGHGGLLEVEVRDPRIDFDDSGGGVVLVAGRRGHAPIARFTHSEDNEGHLLIPAPRLLSAGVALLGGIYDPGDVLDPMEATFYKKRSA